MNNGGYHLPQPSMGSPDLLGRGRSQIEELVVLVTSVVHGMYRYRWPALAVAWAICIGGWSVVYAMPDVYQASTRIYVDTESMTKRIVGDLALASDTLSEINVLTRVMLSQPQLEKVARQADLDLGITNPQQREAVIGNLGQRIHIYKESGENIFRINFADSNRNTAETVVKTLLDNFLEDAHADRRTDSGAAQQFLDQQIGDYEQRLNDAEERLATFKRENIGRMPGDTGDYYTRLQRSMERLAETKADLQLATKRRDEYEQQLAGEEPVFGIVTQGATAAQSGSIVDTQIAQYESDLATLLLRYTENHPDAIALRETIDRLKQKRDAEHAQRPAASAAAQAGDSSLDGNSVYQRMRVGLSETKVDIAALKSKLDTEQTTVDELQRMVDTIPEIERQLTALNRDYDVTREQYEVLLKRRESLRITGEVEQTGDELQFRVIDPPRASLAPVGPDRKTFLLGALVAALGVGAGIAFLLQQLNPVFVNRRELRELTGLPVLGAVSLAQTPRQRYLSKRRRLVFAAVAGALPVALGFAIMLQDPAHRFVASILAAIPT